MTQPTDRAVRRRGAVVFIFEDDQLLREVLVEALYDEGFSARGFESIEALRSNAASDRPALIVSDAWGKSHLSLDPDEQRDIAKVAELAPLILITARAWARNVTAAAIGVMCILEKPVTLDELIGEIVRCFEGRTLATDEPDT